MVLIDMQASVNNQHILCWPTAAARDEWLAELEDAKATAIHVMVSREI